MPPKRLEDQLRDAIRQRGYSRRTEDSYVHWYKEYVIFHRLQHPAALGQAHLTAFLTHLAVDREVSASTQNQAFSALLFLYRAVLKIDLGPIDAVRARRTQYLQPYLSHPECLSVLNRLSGVNRLVLEIIYGGGLRLLEALRLRIKDLDLARHAVTVHDAKNNSSRITFLPDSPEFTARLSKHLAKVRQQYDQHPEIPASLGLALDRKYRRAAAAWEWQYLFPARDIAYDQRTQTLRRHHLHETGVQRAVSQAVKAAGIGKHATVHTFRAAFAHRLQESGCSLDDIRKLMGHADLRTTAHYLDGAPPPHTRWRGPLSEKS